MKQLELFSGHGTISAEFREHDFDTFEIDIRKRKGYCMPDLRADIGTLTPDDITEKFGRPDVIWCSFPCDTFSYFAGSQHYDGKEPISEKAFAHLVLLEHTLSLIESLNPYLYFIENPRGRLRYNTALRSFLSRTYGVTKEVTYSSYGADTIKPTNIFTNAHDWKPRPLDRYGKGATNPRGQLADKPLTERQAIPVQLADEIAFFCHVFFRQTRKRISEVSAPPIKLFTY